MRVSPHNALYALTTGFLYRAIFDLAAAGSYGVGPFIQLYWHYSKTMYYSPHEFISRNYRSDWSFDDFIREGTQLSWLAQETEASSSGNKFIAVDVHDHFMIWYLELKRFLSLKGYFNNKHSDYLKVAPLLDAGNVPRLKGGTEYGNPESLKSQRLLKNIRKEITDILKLLRQISSEADKTDNQNRMLKTTN